MRYFLAAIVGLAPLGFWVPRSASFMERLEDESSLILAGGDAGHEEGPAPPGEAYFRNVQKNLDQAVKLTTTPWRTTEKPSLADGAPLASWESLWPVFLAARRFSSGLVQIEAKIEKMPDEPKFGPQMPLPELIDTLGDWKTRQSDLEQYSGELEQLAALSPAAFGLPAAAKELSSFVALASGRAGELRGASESMKRNKVKPLTAFEGAYADFKAAKSTAARLMRTIDGTADYEFKRCLTDFQRCMQVTQIYVDHPQAAVLYNRARFCKMASELVREAHQLVARRNLRDETQRGAMRRVRIGLTRLLTEYKDPPHDDDTREHTQCGKAAVDLATVIFVAELDDRPPKRPADWAQVARDLQKQHPHAGAEVARRLRSWLFQQLDDMRKGYKVKEYPIDGKQTPTPAKEAVLDDGILITGVFRRVPESPRGAYKVYPFDPNDAAGFTDVIVVQGPRAPLPKEWVDSYERHRLRLISNMNDKSHWGEFKRQCETIQVRLKEYKKLRWFNADKQPVKVIDSVSFGPLSFSEPSGFVGNVLKSWDSIDAILSKGQD